MTETLTPEQYHEELAKTKKGKTNKYRNKRCEYDGHTFDSLAECERYKELKILQATRNIRHLELQPRFGLTMSRIHKTDWASQLICHYVADFAYDEFINGKWVYVVEDVKGGKATQTDVFKLKRKMFEFQYNTKIRIIGG